MSLSHTAAEYMLSDALLPDPGGSRAKGLRLELPSDRLLKFVTVGLPLFLVSLAFAREFSTGESWLLQQGSLGHGQLPAAVWLSLQNPRVRIGVVAVRGGAAWKSSFENRSASGIFIDCF